MHDAKKILLYKQDHFGDPDPLRGVWGDTGCMKSVRGHDFAGVIGIGAAWAEHAIAGKLTWGGLFPHKIGQLDGHPILNFDHFFLLGLEGIVVRSRLSP
jgi:hypothetical protein